MKRRHGQVIVEYTVLFAIVAAVTAISTAVFFMRIARSDSGETAAFERYYQVMAQRIAPSDLSDLEELRMDLPELSEDDRQDPQKVLAALEKLRRKVAAMPIPHRYRGHHVPHSKRRMIARVRNDYLRRIDRAINWIRNNPDDFTPAVLVEALEG